uniref:MADF domain-containing protein n=1 Tax=Ditylenchus dipsaci TaxID=166011 RepID=A0A915E732_9BILA
MIFACEGIADGATEMDNFCAFVARRTWVWRVRIVVVSGFVLEESAGGEPSSRNIKMSTSDDELFASPTKTSVEKPIKSLEEDSKADPILVKLIQEVKKERCLYDKSLKEYLNNTHKGPIWSRIAKWKESVEKVEESARWLCEVDEEEHLPSGSGVTEDTAIASTWPYFDYMTWLDGESKERETVWLQRVACGCRVWRVAAECGHHCEQSVACSCSVWRVAVAAECGVWRHIVNTHAAAAPRHTLKPHAAVTIVNRP